MRSSQRTIAVLIGTGAMLAGSFGPAYADNGPGRYPIQAGPYASTACGFAVVGSSSVDREYQTDEYDASGFLVRSKVTGALFTTLTRVDTGKAIDINNSGLGIYDYRKDGSFTLTDTGHLLYGLHPGDGPGQPGLYHTNGRTVIEFASTGQRTVTYTEGKVENLCTALS